MVKQNTHKNTTDLREMNHYNVVFRCKRCVLY